jgi:hypothetical protein
MKYKMLNGLCVPTARRALSVRLTDKVDGQRGARLTDGRTDGIIVSSASRLWSCATSRTLPSGEFPSRSGI